MPIEIFDDECRRITRGKVRITGGCCLGLTFFIICAILGLAWIVVSLVEVLF